MADNPVIFAMANPDPEITPEEAHEVRPDAIVATGRSDYPNQVNNVLGFPYLFRGALDVHARAINDEMKIACAEALARARARGCARRGGNGLWPKLSFGRDYIIPDAVRSAAHSQDPAGRGPKAGMETGAARRPIVDMEAYETRSRPRMDPDRLDPAVDQRPGPGNAQARMIFAEGDDPRVLRAAVQYQRSGLGKALVVGRESDVKHEARGGGAGDAVRELEIVNAANTRHLETTRNSSIPGCSARGMIGTTFTASRRATGTCSRP